MDEIEENCLYGFELCSNPHIRAIDLCTTKRDVYPAAAEEESEKQPSTVSHDARDSSRKVVL